jgi:hypothetical protein
MRRSTRFSAASPIEGIDIPAGRRPSGAGAVAAASGMRGAGGASGSSENRSENHAPIEPSADGDAMPPRPASVPPRGTGGTRGAAGSGVSGSGVARGVGDGGAVVPGVGTPAAVAASGTASTASCPSGSRVTISVVTPVSGSVTVVSIVEPRRERTSISHSPAGTVAYGVVEP